MLKDGWFTEFSYRNTIGMSYKVRDVLHTEQSQYQKIEVLDTEGLGRLLLLDGKGMLSDADEFVYHEVMGHIPTMVHRNPKKALIIGGGDGGVVREFTKHSDLEQIDLVEIDDRVVAVSKEFFPHCTSGLDDSRVTVHAKDGVQFIKDHKNTYDIIIIDSTDPEDFAAGLFTQEFYQNVYDALTDEGIMMAQTENPFLDEYGIGNFYNNLRAVYPIVQSLYAPMLVYPGVFWTFAFCSKKYQGNDLNPEKLETMKTLEQDLKWYNQDWHKGSFAISNIHKKITGIK